MQSILDRRRIFSGLFQLIAASISTEKVRVSCGGPLTRLTSPRPVPPARRFAFAASGDFVRVVLKKTITVGKQVRQTVGDKAPLRTRDYAEFRAHSSLLGSPRWEFDAGRQHQHSAPGK